MKRFLILLALFASGVVHAAAPQPPCWPFQFGGTGSPVTMEGQAISWRCADGLKYGIGWGREFTPAGAFAATPASASALWDANVGNALGDPVLALWQDPADVAVWAQTWTVAPLAGATSRPTSTREGTVWKSTGQRVPVGAPCDCSTTKIIRGTATWCPAPVALAVCTAGK